MTNSTAELSYQEKLDLLNTLTIEETDPEYILVLDTPENRSVISKVVGEDNLDNYLSKEGGKGAPEDDCIEILTCAFTYAKAHAYVDGKFLRYTEEELLNKIDTLEDKLELKERELYKIENTLSQVIRSLSEIRNA